MAALHAPKLTVFHCVNSLNEEHIQSYTATIDIDVKTIHLPCSSMVKDVFLLRAFEAGADAVAVLVCPENQCRHLQGSKRAKKRVDRTRLLLDEIGLNGDRLSFFNVSSSDPLAAEKILQEIATQLSELGPIRIAA